MDKNRTPQDKYYKKSNLNHIFVVIMYIIFTLLSLAQGFTNNHIILVFSAISVILIFILEKFKDYYFDKGILYRRVKLLDNTFNQLHEPEEAIFEYYDNEEIEPGIYKLFWNIYESAFFSHFIISKMLRLMFWYASIIFILLLIFVLNFGINIYSLLALSLVFSNAFFNRIYSLKSTKNSIEKILGKSAILADNMKNTVNNDDFMRRMMDIIINYESTIAENKYNLSNKTYMKSREALNCEWNSIKKKYYLRND
ncbi:hypothetical protein [Mammaliicoccus sciuri]|uniref:hypothetical protein n=1 Tax=Mammaliicoccus sciuri TaxID=1296 RepID=UPI001FB55B3C|nr:hypothetical protein [Mammaliicoccus sciuri]MCJ0920593.1 hypothetical protein [Mammaliicoccus sciuri]MCJ0958399.1 hypothetical protein [Mammaliicoccus sciuri]MCJ0963410.1 hypothetical protein [Mammaliicoccus sciuri]MCJ1777079.1 hypothetical protein [Mammaliicoccus sciuri]